MLIADDAFYACAPGPHTDGLLLCRGIAVVGVDVAVGGVGGCGCEGEGWGGAAFGRGGAGVCAEELA